MLKITVSTNKIIQFSAWNVEMQSYKRFNATFWIDIKVKTPAADPVWTWSTLVWKVLSQGETQT